MCNCHSYNGDFGNVQEVLLDPNKYFPFRNKAKKVSVDFCISKQIKMLWENSIWTDGCCCGHNGEYGSPNVIIHESQDPNEAIKLLKQNDPNREWDVLQWQLTKCEL